MNDETRNEKVAWLAFAMALNPRQAVLLPAAIASAAMKLDISEEEFIVSLQTNQRMRNYIGERIATAEKIISEAKEILTRPLAND